jgi:hypothetical protein
MGKIPVVEFKSKRRSQKKRWQFLRNKPLSIVLISLAAIGLAIFLWFFLYLPSV